MNNSIGIRREYKNKWEKRTPLTPEAVSLLHASGIVVMVQSSENRVYSDQDYVKAGAKLVTELDSCKVILGIKEPRIEDIKQDQVHLAFSHTIKGQAYNMPLLRRILDLGVTLIDYELFTNDSGIRTLAFGRFAGIAGAVDSLWVYARKNLLQGKTLSFPNIKPTWEYAKLDTLFDELKKMAPISDSLQICITGGGNVSKGAEEVCKALGIKQIRPEDALLGMHSSEPYYFLVDIPDFIRHISGKSFNQSDYFSKGIEEFESIFNKFLGSFNLLLHGAYWDPRYPRILPRSVIRSSAEDKRPQVIGDISCDIDGSIEITDRATSIDEPSCTYYPETDQYQSGTTAEGISFMSIDNLPCELSIDASKHFSGILSGLVPYLYALNADQSFEEINLPPVLKRAVIAHGGKLTPKFSYLRP